MTSHALRRTFTSVILALGMLFLGDAPIGYGQTTGQTSTQEVDDDDDGMDYGWVGLLGLLGLLGLRGRRTDHVDNRTTRP